MDSIAVSIGTSPDAISILAVEAVGDEGSAPGAAPSPPPDPNAIGGQAFSGVVAAAVAGSAPMVRVVLSIGGGGEANAQEATAAEPAELVARLRSQLSVPSSPLRSSELPLAARLEASLREAAPATSDGAAPVWRDLLGPTSPPSAPPLSPPPPPPPPPSPLPPPSPSPPSSPSPQREQFGGNDGGGGGGGGNLTALVGVAVGLAALVGAAAAAALFLRRRHRPPFSSPHLCLSTLLSRGSLVLWSLGAQARLRLLCLDGS